MNIYQTVGNSKGSCGWPWGHPRWGLGESLLAKGRFWYCLTNRWYMESGACPRIDVASSRRLTSSSLCFYGTAALPLPGCSVNISTKSPVLHAILPYPKAEFGVALEWAPVALGKLPSFLISRVKVKWANEAGEIDAQLLRALSALPENSILVLSIYTRWLTLPVTTVPGDLIPSLASGHLHTHVLTPQRYLNVHI